MNLGIYYIGYADKKPHLNVNIVNPLYLMINRIDHHLGDKYLKIADTDRNSDVLKRYLEVWNGIKDCIEKINKDDSELKAYDKDYMKIKLKTENDVPLN